MTKHGKRRKHSNAITDYANQLEEKDFFSVYKNVNICPGISHRWDSPQGLIWNENMSIDSPAQSV